MKLLLYCTKAKPYLWNNKASKEYMEERGIEEPSFITSNDLGTSFACDLLNGKIVAECDFEVEKIFYSQMFCNYTTWSLGKDDLLDKSCLTYDELKNYLGTKDVIGNDGYNGYAIIIKNLHIFDKPKELNDYYNNKNLMKDILEIWENYGLPDKDDYDECSIKKAPQNMCRAFDEKNDYILISIKPEWLCKILNGEKTIEVRKKVLKEMLNNE